MAVLRAAHALGFDRFKAFAISYLENKWSDNLANFARGRIEYPADAIRLARRLNINSVLKRALYELVRADGFREDDNETDFAPDTSELPLLVHAREQLVIFWMRQAVLPPHAKGCYGSEDSQDVWRCAAFLGEAQTLYNTLVHDSNIFEDYRHDPITGLKALLDAPWVFGEAWPSTYPKQLPTVETNHLCSACGKKWRVIWRRERKKLWDDLNVWFKLKD